MYTKQNFDHTRRIAERYFDGESTPDEEAILRDFFRETPPDALPKEMRSMAAMFRGFSAIGEEKMSSEYGRALLGHQVSRPIIRRRPFIWGASLLAAASMALAVIIPATRTVYGYTADGKAITDPATALEQADCLGELASLESSMEIADGLLMMMERSDLGEGL